MSRANYKLLLIRLCTPGDFNGFTSSGLMMAFSLSRISLACLR